MGSLCCCLRGADFDEESVDSDENEQISDSNPAVSRTPQEHFTSVIQNLTNKCEAFLGRRTMDPMPSSSRGPSSSQLAQTVSSGSSSSSSSGMGVYLTRPDKRSYSSRIGPEPVQERNFRSVPSDGASKESQPETLPMEKVKRKVGILSEDDEDVCPICLEEYTTENPRIITRCLHHYHLSCIYEWKERSEICPVCSKLMVFEEMA